MFKFIYSFLSISINACTHIVEVKTVLSSLELLKHSGLICSRHEHLFTHNHILPNWFIARLNNKELEYVCLLKVQKLYIHYIKVYNVYMCICIFYLYRIM